MKWLPIVLAASLTLLIGCNRPSETLELYMDEIRPAKEAEKVRIGKQLVKLKCTVSVDTLNDLFEEDPIEGLSWMLRCAKSNPAFFGAYDQAKPILAQLNADLKNVKIPKGPVPLVANPPTFTPATN